MVVIVVCGPIASGKSTVARAVARLFEARRTEAAAIDLDLVYEMLEHHGAPRKNNRATWSRARRAAAALTDALLEDGVTVVIMEGEFMSPQDRGEFSSALRSAVLPVFVTSTSQLIELSSVWRPMRRAVSPAIQISFVATTKNSNALSIVDPRQTSSSIPAQSVLRKLLA